MPTSQSVNQSINPSINQSINQPINQSIPQSSNNTYHFILNGVSSWGYIFFNTMVLHSYHSQHTFLFKCPQCQIKSKLWISWDRITVKENNQTMFITLTTSLILKQFKQGYILPIFKGGYILPIFKGGYILPISKQGNILPIFKGGYILPIFKGGYILPISK